MIVLLPATMSMGCAATPPPDEVPVHGAGKCDAAKAQALVGRDATSALAAEAMRLTGARTMRWVPKDGVITMDYREDRLNIHLDGQNRVARINCG